MHDNPPVDVLIIFHVLDVDSLILCTDESLLLSKSMNTNSSQSKWDSVKRYRLTKMLNELSSITGHGTELVTVYVPPRRQLFDVISQLRNEAGTASNIKSDLTRTHV